MAERVVSTIAKHIAVIASGATESDAIPFGDFAQGGILLPAEFTGTSVSFKVSHDGETFEALYDSANALVAITVTQGRAYAFPASIFPFKEVKLVSNASETAERSIPLSLKY